MTRIALNVLRGDITKLSVDAIVNAANEHLVPGGGVCGAIHRAAGPGLAAACRDIGYCETGNAVMTDAFDLPCRYVIHAVGPVWHDGAHREPERLASCYQRAIALAEDRGLATIAFPAISCGIFGYPHELAVPVAIRAVTAATASAKHLREVTFCVMDDALESCYRRYLSLLTSAS
ncbi:macro domain-containing protein [Mangrovitalea sediminis]|uniref:macro domain-containing protein n=1 Tax=Mangrovitalea sediminis TaxID=1982043 RepID=UPI000BE4B320|nr:macro domain-containing protein [Mangrovitalea sediminis]